jgi:type IV secretion system protein VirB11
MSAGQARARQVAMLHEMLGPLVREALAQPGTVEVMVNADGTVWHETYGAAQVYLGHQDPAMAEGVIRLVAALNNTVCHRDKPSLAGTLPGGERFQGWIPPRAKAPSYCIRVHQVQVLTREHYVPTCCSVAIWDAMAQAVAARQTVLLAGRMGSGKTTLFNTLLSLIPDSVRVVTIEDTAEVSVGVPNHLQLYGSADENLDAVVKEGFRSNGQRMPVGEIRDGKTAIQTLNLWLAVGGGLATTHGDSARDALARLEYLCAQASPGDYGYLLGGVIDLVVYLQTVDGRRQITEVLTVDWKEGQYVLGELPDA